MSETKLAQLARRWRWTILGLLAFGLFLGAIAARLWFEGSAGLALDRPAPTIVLETFEHGRIDTGTLIGKVIVVNFWGSWCPSCHLEAADLQRLWERYRRDDVFFIGVAYLDTEHDARAYLKQYGIDYPNGLDYSQRITKQFRIQGAPETFLVNRRGQIRFFHAGPINPRQLAREIENALADSA